MHTVLIANRGEIAVRIVHACHDAGLRAVAVYADGDADALHVELADEAHSLAGATAAETYLDAAKVLAAAARSGADAVHPGYGFLSEDAGFARAVIEAGLIWIGPPPEAIETLGDKVAARALAQRVGAPLVPGSDGTVACAAEARAFAEEHGLPIAVKAAFGGGGRGLRVVHHLEDVVDAFTSAQAEARAAFGRDECFVERYLDAPRHVEVQVLADQHGRVAVLGTRDCSLQRRHQKLLEEAPAPFLDDDQHERLVEGARTLVREAGYVGAGTVEFLLGRDGTLSFLEVNTRLQVEHPVTEVTTGIDIVAAQLSIAAGEPLPFEGDPQTVGHAIELRINAEDVARGFLPALGTIEVFDLPTGPGVRVDTGVRRGAVVSGDFDSLLAKVVVHGRDRQEALRRARRAAAEMRIAGVATVLPFHRAVLADPRFTSATDFSVSTTWIEREFDASTAVDPDFSQAGPALARHRVVIDVDGRRTVLGLPADLLAGLAGSGGNTGALGTPSTAGGGPAGPTPGTVSAPMGGTVVRWLADPGAQVDEGDGLVVLEAMKMEVTVPAPCSGTLDPDRVEVGDRVQPGAPLAHVTGRSA